MLGLLKRLTNIENASNVSCDKCHLKRHKPGELLPMRRWSLMIHGSPQIFTCDEITFDECTQKLGGKLACLHSLKTREVFKESEKVKHFPIFCQFSICMQKINISDTIEASVGLTYQNYNLE